MARSFQSLSFLLGPRFCLLTGATKTLWRFGHANQPGAMRARYWTRTPRSVPSGARRAGAEDGSAPGTQWS